MYASIKDKLTALEKEMNGLSTPLIRRRFKVTLQMAMELKRKFYEEDNAFKCALCGMTFDPSDHQNDVCDKCLYKR